MSNDTAAATNKFDYSAQWGLAYSTLDATLKRIERMILATPTGDRRNKLTEVNILLMQVKKELQRAA